jgi:hypothetical protein
MGMPEIIGYDALLAETTLKARDEVRRSLEEAEKAGRTKGAISWRSRLRKLDERITLYGLDRYASRP